MNPVTKEVKAGMIDYKKDELPFYPRWQCGSTLIGTCYYGEIADSPLLSKIIPVTLSVMEEETPVLLFFEVK